MCLENNRKKRKRASSLVMSKKSRRLLAFSPIEDETRRLEQMASLATALTATAAEFSNELTYRPNMAPKSANSPALEREGMQVYIIIQNLNNLVLGFSVLRTP